MSIPLVRNNTRDAINTSIIAIKKNLERINSLLGLADSSEPDLSGLATKQELEDAVSEINNTIDEVETSLQPVNSVTSGNMHSVTSGAVKDYTDTLIKIYQKEIGTYTVGAGQTISPNINSYTNPAPNGYSRFSFLYAESENYFHCDVNFANGVAYATITNEYTQPLTSKFILYHIYIPWSGIIT